LITDDDCKALEAQWKLFDPDASILPGIGLPSQYEGVCTIIHQFPNMAPMVINGLISMSALSNYALFSTECASPPPACNSNFSTSSSKPPASVDGSIGGGPGSSAVHSDNGGMGGSRNSTNSTLLGNPNAFRLHLYEIMLPDYPSVRGRESSVQLYIKFITARGLNIAGVHFHWLGVSGPPMIAIHHQSTSGILASEFVNATQESLFLFQDLIGFSRLKSNSTSNETVVMSSPAMSSPCMQFPTYSP
jgi:hypothetical protein